MRRPVLAALGALLIAGAPAGATEREYIYGAELMSAKERDAYRRGLAESQDDQARQRHRERHRERLQVRAQRRGMQLDDKGIVRREGNKP